MTDGPQPTPQRRALRPIVVALLVVAIIEVTAVVVPRVGSPVFALADLLVDRTPGPLATWFLSTFRGLARPLTLAFATVCVTVAVVGLGRLMRPVRLARSVEDRAEDRAASVPGGRPLGRRVLVGGLLAGSAALIGSRLIGSSGTLDTGGGATPMPLGARSSAARPLPPVTAAQELAAGVPGLSPILTPTRDFYRIDTALRLPGIDRGRWRLRIHGLVEEEVELDLDGLLALGLVEHDVTLSCVSNEVGGGLVGTARWTGVPLSEVLALARPLPEATQLVGRSTDGWTAGFPTELAATPGALVAVGMNGEELPRQHGWPARLVVPGLYGYVSATKWLTEIELTTWEGFDAFWIVRRWAKEGPIKLASRVDVPPASVPIRAGTVRTAGVAWGPDRGISRVEVRVDEGPWRDAVLSDPLGTSTWVQWIVDVEVPEGRHDIQVRAYDGDGARQSPGPAPVLPDGAEGWHRRSVRADA
jgi:DMSO/TMAO reductase YedYZ molybdopterin-dependent catalytic subunit